MKVNYKILKENGFLKQVQKDKFSLRIRVAGGNLDAKQFQVLADIAETYGNGNLHLTSRQSVEIPFIPLESITDIQEKLKQEGIRTSSCGATVRTITACHGSALCASGCIDTQELAKELDSRYHGRELPHKFKFGVTGCRNNCLKAEENDVGIKGGIDASWLRDPCILCGRCEKVCRDDALNIKDGTIFVDKSKCTHCGKCVKACPVGAWDARSGYQLSFGGRFGQEIQKGQYLLPMITDKETLFQILDKTLAVFIKYGKPGERFVKTIERIGWEKLKSEINPDSCAIMEAK